MSVGIKPMISRMRRITPNCGYAEVEVIEHVGSWHKPGDVILISMDEYNRGRTIPTEEKPDGNDAGRKSKSKS